MASHSFRLVPFAAPAPLDVEITGTVALEVDVLSVTYRISGAIDQIKVAAPRAQPSRKDELWRTTCFELFVKLPERAEYWEYNLSPSRDWNVYRFTSYRSALQQEPQIADINVATETAQTHLTSVRAALPLPAALREQKLVIGVSSVIEDARGNVHYFALRHDGAKPDFHDPAGFVLSLEPAA
jgi:hypothetical protein